MGGKSCQRSYRVGVAAVGGSGAGRVGKKNNDDDESDDAEEAAAAAAATTRTGTTAAAVSGERSLASELRTTSVAVTIGAAGAMAGTAMGASLPWMLGSLTATSLVSLAGVSLRVYGPLKTTMQAVVGVSLGANFTPDMLLNIYNNGLTSMLGLVFFTCCAAATSSWYLARVAGYDPTTAFFAGAPGEGGPTRGRVQGGGCTPSSFIHLSSFCLRARNEGKQRKKVLY